jgi:hypothetical protein
MTSFKDTRVALLLSHDEGDLDDDEFLVLYNLYTSNNPRFPFEDYEQFDLKAIDILPSVKQNFAFKKIFHFLQKL